MSANECTGSNTALILHSCDGGRRGWDTCCSDFCTAEAVHSISTSRIYINLKDLKGATKAFSTVYTTVLYFKSLVGVMRASSPSMSCGLVVLIQLNSSGRGTTFSSFMVFVVCVLSCGCVRRTCSCMCVCVNRLHAKGAVTKDSKTCQLPHVKHPR